MLRSPLAKSRPCHIASLRTFNLKNWDWIWSLWLQAWRVRSIRSRPTTRQSLLSMPLLACLTPRCMYSKPFHIRIMTNTALASSYTYSFLLVSVELYTLYTRPGSKPSSHRLSAVERVVSEPSVHLEEASKLWPLRTRSLLLVLMDQLSPLGLWRNRLMTRAGSQTTTSTAPRQSVFKAPARRSKLWNNWPPAWCACVRV